MRLKDERRAECDSDRTHALLAAGADAFAGDAAPLLDAAELLEALPGAACPAALAGTKPMGAACTHITDCYQAFVRSREAVPGAIYMLSPSFTMGSISCPLSD